MIKVASMFAQVISLINRNHFARMAHRLGAERATKGFSCWDQLVAMLFGQLAAAHSLREISGGLATAMGKLVHLGMKAAPARSTLSYANAHRPWQLFEAVFHQVLEEATSVAALHKRRFRFKNPLRSLDASTIDLCLNMFDWARFRRTKGAVKLHLLLDHQGCLPCWALITDGKTHDVKAARWLDFAPGTVVAMDRGYVDYRLFSQWTEAGVWFVTRAKDNMDYRVVKRRSLPLRGNVRRDEEMVLQGFYARQNCPHRLRRVVVWDDENEREIVLLTNHMDFAASTIARIYKDRWQIELFFKALKQNLKIKTFVGTSENAVQIQIWTALIAMLLLKILQLRSTFGWSLSNLAALLRLNLLTYRDLWRWLDSPFETPAVGPPAQQILLFE
ncbi:MAG: IS4 family transposase [Sedimentisphaerales bacterium]|nr:IS4 family transposase [Sedimentisphaerales bacterium]